MGSGALRLLSSRFQDGMIFKSNFIYTPKAIVVLESLDEAIREIIGRIAASLTHGHFDALERIRDRDVVVAFEIRRPHRVADPLVE